MNDNADKSPNDAPDTLLTMEGATKALDMDANQIMQLIEDGSLAPAPSGGEDLLFVPAEIEQVRRERL